MLGRPLRVTSTTREALDGFIRRLRDRLVEQQDRLRRIDRLSG